MKYIEPHAHMVSRTTADYEAMALAGCKVISEPAFWAGYDRSSEQGFHDYFSLLTGFEPQRAAKFGIKHFTWMCINPKEAEDVGLANAVIDLIPEFLKRDNVLGIGEIGLNKNSRNELEVLERHIDLADQHDQLILVHTPHLEDKLKGTRLIIDALKNFSNITTDRVIIDHVEEHTVGMVKDAGFWAGMTLYPESKLTARRAIDILEKFGTDKIWMNSACDWGVSEPLATPKAARMMAQRGHSEEMLDKVFYQNPKEFMSQNSKFTI
ncbi:MAG: TatD family hydrolase [Verrucomicrobiales bacterium]|nr:TatD family hydrolase [Verrucomicrobiales bacterium]